MPRLLYADPGSQLVYQRLGTSLRSANGRTATVYADAAGTTLADIAAYDPSNPGVPGAVIAGSTLIVDTFSLLPWFWGPLAGDDTLWVQVDGGPVAQINAYYDPRIDAAATAAGLAAETSARIAADTALGLAITVGDAASVATAAADATTKANAAQATAIASAAASAIQKSLVDAKGDLLVGTADDTVARLAVGTAGYIPVADPAAASGLSYQPRDPDQFAAGTTTMDRKAATASPTCTSQLLRLMYFTAPRAETIANVAVLTSGTAAGATPTLCRIGVYSVAANGDLTLVGACANDTSLFATINTRYARALSASYNAVLGQRYAMGVLVVTAAATPTFVGIAPNSALVTSFSTSPRISGSLAGQSDLPSSIAAGSVAATTVLPYGEVLP